MDTLLAVILAPTIPDASRGVMHAGNWPNDAMYAIAYLCVDRQFDVQSNREENIEYFSNAEELEEWYDRKIKWIEGTDYDFSITGKVYKWDFGPEYWREVSL